MRHLHTAIHPDVDLDKGKAIDRLSVRAIVLNGDNILLMYTERYHDYTLPGGGVDSSESLEQALIRELKEETGAHKIKNITLFGQYREYRPWYKDNADIIHIDSICFTCSTAEKLGETQFEAHEIANGMTPKWVNIFDAIAHNEQTIAQSDKKGMSIERETFLLKLIAKELVASSHTHS